MRKVIFYRLTKKMLQGEEGGLHNIIIIITIYVAIYRKYFTKITILKICFS